MTAQKHIDHLHRDDCRQARGGRLQIQVVVLAQHAAVLPSSAVQHEEECSQRGNRFQQAEEQVSAQQRGLAAAGRAAQRKKIACLDTQADIIQRNKITEAARDISDFKLSHIYAIQLSAWQLLLSTSPQN